ncbi:hypothetical protein KI387_001952 [Taxus chinensis]|uniref:RRM domain-containing protein n=2 Tax=Taxus chinensis TaxID=29808 RepID=A0AA38GU09_TAXCH|nr:hypothetical protein KI387_001952 [Taxus chinensis]
MDCDDGKIFVGGISWDTSEERVKEYFGAYGEVVDVVIMKDRTTRRARGFGFVVFADPSVTDRVIQDKHNIDGRNVEAKKVVPRDEQQTSQRTSNIAGPRTKKIFVGGLAPTVTEDDFRKYFEHFGNITDVVVMYDHTTQRHRGFGFITYDSEDAVDNVLEQTFHELKEKTVEVKRAIPKEMSSGNSRGPAGRGAGYGGPYMQGYGPSPVGAYGVRLPLARSGYSPYGPAPAYGPTGYGNTPGYGTNTNGGYGAGPVYGVAAGYAGAAAGSYGAGFNTAPGSTPYGSGTAGYTAAAVPTPYGNAAVGARTSWGTGGGSPGYAAVGAGSWGSTASAGQHAGAAAGYGYASGETGYGSRSDCSFVQGGSGYGAPAGVSGGSYSGGYGDTHGPSSYGNS